MTVHTRLIPTLTLKDGRIIKTVQFDRYRDVGSPVTMGKVFESHDIDELVFLDITASQEGRDPHYDVIEAFADETAMPLTIGGGVKTLEQANRLLRIGADKIAMNSVAFGDPEFLSRAAQMFGSQCIVQSIDARKKSDGSYETLVEGGATPTGIGPVEMAKKGEELGAGEILLTSVDRDGTMEGYDLELIRLVSEAVRIPVIVSGGCGLLVDLVEAVQSGASAVACASIFAFSSNKPMKARAFMLEAGVNVRPA